MKTHNDITHELDSMGSPLAGLPRTMPYGIPQHYFVQLAETMAAIAKAYNEPDAALNLSKTNPFAIPDGYFNDLAAQIKAVVTEAELQLNIERSMPFDLPKGYFEELPIHIATLAAEKNIKEIARGNMPYSVSPFYFQQLPAAVLLAAKTKERKIISLNIVWQQVRLAVAAVFLLGVGFGTMHYYLQQQRPIQNTEVALARVPQNTISDYVQLNIDDFDQEMIYSSIGAGMPIQPDQLTKDEITQYLDETGGQ
jgi:hypothetical protein